MTRGVSDRWFRFAHQCRSLPQDLGCSPQDALADLSSGWPAWQAVPAGFDAERVSSRSCASPTDLCTSLLTLPVLSGKRGPVTRSRRRVHFASKDGVVAGAPFFVR